VTRVVIRLENDISEVMPVLARNIQGCAFGPQVPIVSFRYNNWRVVVQKDEIMVLDVEDESSALKVMGFLKNTLEKTSEV